MATTDAVDGRIERRPCDGVMIARTITEAAAAEMQGNTSAITI